MEDKQIGWEVIKKLSKKDRKKVSHVMAMRRYQPVSIGMLQFIAQREYKELREEWLQTRPKVFDGIPCSCAGCASWTDLLNHLAGEE